LLEGGIDLVWSQLCEALLEEVDAQLDVEIFFLEVVNVLLPQVVSTKMKYKVEK
jgi:hypothetical protein